MKPATAAAIRATGKLMPNPEFTSFLVSCVADGFGKETDSSSAANCPSRVARCQTSTVTPTMAFKVAAKKTVLDCPSQPIRNMPAQKQPAAEPNVFAAYSPPTEVPTLRERRIVWETRIGNVEPISTVGMTTSVKATRPVLSGADPAVKFAAQ